MSIEKLSTGPKISSFGALPILETSDLVPVSSIQQFLSSPKSNVVDANWDGESQKFFVDDYRTSDSHHYISGHLRCEDGFKETIFDVRMPGFIGKCISKAVGREPRAHVSITQYDGISPALHEGQIERYKRIVSENLEPLQ